MNFELRCDSFTGGCDTGIAICKKAGMIPMQMELGGKDSCIILEDADLELAATNIIKGGFSYRFFICALIQVPGKVFILFQCHLHTSKRYYPKI